RRAPDRRQIQPEESGLPHRASTWRHGRGTLLPFRLCQSKTELRMSQAVCRSQERHHYTRGGRSKRGEPMRFEDMFAKTIVLAVAALLAGSAILQAQSKTDVTGKWALEVRTQAGGTTMPEVTLKQEGEKLTGHYTSEALGDANVTGTIKGQQIEFSFN